MIPGVAGPGPTGAPAPPAPPGTPAGAAQAAQEFEAILLAQLLKGLRRTVPAGDDQSHMSQVYQELFDEQVAVELARAGGVGLARVVLAYLERSPGGAARP